MQTVASNLLLTYGSSSIADTHAVVGDKLVVAFRPTGVTQASARFDNQTFNLDGTGTSVPVRVNVTDIGVDKVNPKITALGGPNGGFLVTRSSFTPVMGRIFNADGTARSGESQFGIDVALTAWDVAATADGCAMVAFAPRANGIDKSPVDVFLAKVGATGTVEPAQRVNGIVLETQNEPAIAIGADGRILVTYNDQPAWPLSPTMRMTLLDEGAGVNIPADPAPQMLDGTVFADVIDGGGGDDTINGLAGTDTLNGGAGNDIINGGDDNDTFGGDADDDVIRSGNSGTKQMVFTVVRTGGTIAFSVDFQTVGMTATAGSGCVATSGRLDSGTGERSKTVSVTINNANTQFNGSGIQRSLSDIFSATDADGDSVQRWEFWDHTVGNGGFQIAGHSLPARTVVGMTAAEFATGTFASGPGDDDVWARAFDGFDWSDWKYVRMDNLLA